jgi:AcrR family transcriptional regulator
MTSSESLHSQPPSTKAQATVQKILDASLKRVIEQGESGLSMTAICQELGISRPTLYRYFPTREALLKGVFEQVLTSFRDGILEAIATNPEPARRVEVIATFIEGRMLDGGAQLYELNPALIIELIMGSRSRLKELASTIFSPLLEMSEALNGKPADKETIANSFILLNLSLSLFKVHGEIDDLHGLLRKTIRALLTITED